MAIINHFKGNSAIIVTHAADRTGAPQIIFNVAKQLFERFGVKCITFSLKDGPLLAEFKKFGEAWVVANNKLSDKNISIHLYIEDLIVKPSFAIINTACCGSIYSEINKGRIPIITLIHDYTYPFGKEYLQNIYHFSDHIVYPVQFMIDQNIKDYPFDLGKTSVIPQGLYKKEMLEADYKTLREKSRKKYNIPENAFVVLGSGFIHPRKGIDIFINSAIQVLSEKNNVPVYFFWLGGELDQLANDEYIRFMARDIINTNNSEFIRFIKESIDVVPYFAMSDLFFLSSREDPFPTVVMEAFATGLPVIAVEGSSGSLEIIKKTGNFSVPYNKRSEIANEILQLIQNRKRLKASGMNGRELMIGDYSFDNYVDKMIDLISSKIDFNPDQRPLRIKTVMWKKQLDNINKLLKKFIC